MKYLFTLLATCFVLGLSAQKSSDNVSKLIDDQIELVKNDLVSQNNEISKNVELTSDDKVRISENLALTTAQITILKKNLLKNAKAMIDLENSNIESLEKKERRLSLEAEKNYIIFQNLNPQQQAAFKTANGMN